MEKALVTIERDVPLPSRGHGVGYKYPFPEMEPGDSIFIPGKTGSEMGSALSNYRVSKHGQGKVFTSRTVDGGCRIWRVS